MRSARNAISAAKMPDRSLQSTLAKSLLFAFCMASYS